MGMRSAIDKFCKDCIYDSKEPGKWREQVDACTSQDCSLWPYRPRKSPPKDVPTPQKTPD